MCDRSAAIPSALVVGEGMVELRIVVLRWLLPLAAPETKTPSSRTKGMFLLAIQFRNHRLRHLKMVLSDRNCVCDCLFLIAYPLT